MKIEIDSKAGFCHGVVNAIHTAEICLKKRGKDETIYCLGDIVHNKTEVERLKSLGLVTINYEEFENLSNCKVIVRAHGEPPSTFFSAKEREITIIDATCPIVGKLQREIKACIMNQVKGLSEIIIVGKKGHPEVLGLLGQIDNNAIVISSVEDVKNNFFKQNITIFSQTTMDKTQYAEIIKEIVLRAECRKINITNSICKHVLKRKDSIQAFAQQHQIVLFVSSSNSSNGMYLFNICKEANQYTYLLNSSTEVSNTLNIAQIKFAGKINSIGISGATSTPMWLMKEVAHTVNLFYLNNNKN